MKENSNAIPEWIVLNSSIVDDKGQVQDLARDRAAARSYFLNYINKKTQFFHSLKEKLDYLIDNDYYESEFLEKYTHEEIKEIFNLAYDAKFRFPTFMGAFKFYNDYALKSRESDWVFLERYEDRLSVVALYHANGDMDRARGMIKLLISQDFTPATPTLLNTGRSKRGEFVSCFLLEINDSLNDISRANEFAMQLSKRGGGVALNMSNLRAKGEAIKKTPGVAKGVVGVAKLLDNAFRYADQMGQRQGAGAVYLSAFHADIEDFLQTRKINADDDIRLKTLSIGVSIPDKMIELVKADRDMYVFYPHTVFEEYGVPFADISAEMDVWYDKLVENPNVRKRKINPRRLMETIALVQAESGYPYIFFADNVNIANPNEGLIKFSNLCTEILQTSEVSSYGDYGQNDDKVGLDISCNLASGHMGNMINHNTIKETVFSAMDIMNSVSENTDIVSVPGVARANQLMRSVGFGIMGHHGFIAENMIPYGSKENIELVDVFFNTVNYWSLVHSMNKAKETGETFYNFKNSDYANGSYFDTRGEILPTHEIVKEMFKDIYLPTDADWAELKANVIEHGLYNSYRLAIAPTGSISYVMSATASLTPIRQTVEERTYGNSKTYYPMPHADKVGFMYDAESAYDLNNFDVINVIAAAQKHVDQGISFEIAVNSNVTTRDLQKTWLYAHHKGLKTLYYLRQRKLSIDECLSCAV